MLHIETDGPVRVLTMDRPEAKNAVDPAQADRLRAAFAEIEADEAILATVLTGAGGTFCAGADLKAAARGEFDWSKVPHEGPLGPTRWHFSKPVIAAVEGYCVAGGLELAAMCDMRVASETAIFGIFERRWGVPLVDGGTVRLPRLIGQSRALDMILTGRPVAAQEALSFGLANRVVPAGEARAAAVALAHDLAKFPQTCMLNDRESVLSQWALPLDAALQNEAELGMGSVAAGANEGAGKFAQGAGRGGNFNEH
ncbi:crotonase/enoyl-CoA hydratase family protein [Rhodobacteraceae bacterium NNCM2]|nr:crotonase/enoyl-CoA hydratase family protein [Coraliihabitans acroporae]